MIADYSVASKDAAVGVQGYIIAYGGMPAMKSVRTSVCLALKTDTGRCYDKLKQKGAVL